MAHLKLKKPINVPNLMFFHNKWLDEKFTNAFGTVILELRPNEKSNLKRLMAQTLNLERCVAKFSDIVQMLLKVGVTNFEKPAIKDIDSWTQLLVFFVAIIAKHQGWNPELITRKNEIKTKEKPKK